MSPRTPAGPRRDAGAGEPPDGRSALRTQSIALVAWAAGAGALAAALYPMLAAALFAFLAGLVMVVTLRWTLWRGLVAGLLAMAPFAFAERTLDALDGVAGHEEILCLLLGVALLLGSAAVADAASTAIGRLPAPGGRQDEPVPVWGGNQALRERDDGLRRAEWELARAMEYGREVTLALVGIDVPAGVDASTTRLDLLRRLDELVLESVTRFDVLGEYGLYERLMVLPEESASGIGEHATQLCAVATERLGRRVRMALATFPAQGSTLRALLTELEIDLAGCRMNDLMVQICGVPDRTAPAGAGRSAEPMLLLEPDGGAIGAPAPAMTRDRATSEVDGRVMSA